MVSVTKYFRDGRPDLGNDLQVALSTDDLDVLSDPETRGASEYLKSVREESRKLPFAVVADINEFSPSVSTGRASPSLAPSLTLRHDRLRDAVLEYFVTLREVIEGEKVEKRDVLLDFGEDLSALAVADAASIARGLEDLSELLDELDEVSVSTWLFGLLVHAQVPLLEDTAAALQVLRRYCERGASLRLEVSSLVIRDYFRQS